MSPYTTSKQKEATKSAFHFFSSFSKYMTAATPSAMRPSQDMYPIRL